MCVHADRATSSVTRFVSRVLSRPRDRVALLRPVIQSPVGTSRLSLLPLESDGGRRVTTSGALIVTTATSRRPPRLRAPGRRPGCPRCQLRSADSEPRASARPECRVPSRSPHVCAASGRPGCAARTSEGGSHVACPWVSPGFAVGPAWDRDGRNPWSSRAEALPWTAGGRTDPVRPLLACLSSVWKSHTFKATAGPGAMTDIIVLSAGAEENTVVGVRAEAGRVVALKTGAPGPVCRVAPQASPGPDAEGQSAREGAGGCRGRPWADGAPLPREPEGRVSPPQPSRGPSVYNARDDEARLPSLVGLLTTMTTRTHGAASMLGPGEAACPRNFDLRTVAVFGNQEFRNMGKRGLEAKRLKTRSRSPHPRSPRSRESLARAPQ